MPMHQEKLNDMQLICARAVDPFAVRADTERRIREAHAQQVARACNAERAMLGQLPEFTNPDEVRALRPVRRFGVATPFVWHACVGHGNMHMKQNGVRNPCYALPRQADREAHEAAERTARELAATLAEEAKARHAAAAEEIRESVLPTVGWDELEELFGQEDLLELVH